MPTMIPYMNPPPFGSLHHPLTANKSCAWIYSSISWRPVTSCTELDPISFVIAAWIHTIRSTITYNEICHFTFKVGNDLFGSGLFGNITLQLNHAIQRSLYTKKVNPCMYSFIHSLLPSPANQRLQSWVLVLEDSLRDCLYWIWYMSRRIFIIFSY